MSILETMTNSERTALVMLERRNAREKIRIFGILGDCIAPAFTTGGGLSGNYKGNSALTISLARAESPRCLAAKRRLNRCR